ILKTLAQVKHGVAIVVQKEDFLRPDLGTENWGKQSLRVLYDDLKSVLDPRIDWPGLINNLSFFGGGIEPVRCVGNSRNMRQVSPLMHNKFVVFCKPQFFEQESRPSFEPRPYAVWTGSFNFTRNAIQSLENAVYIADPRIAEAYYKEWEQIEAVSEQLDWTTEW